MWRRVSRWLYRISNGWITVAALIVFLLFSALVLPRQAAQAEGESADAGSPDLALWYSTGELYAMAEAYGEQGRKAYVRARFTFDLAWPLVYGAFLTSAISWLYARAFPPGSRQRLANLAPPLGVALDYLENLSTSVVMLRYPGRTPVIDALAPVFTLVKWALVGGSFVLLVAGLVAVVWQRIAQRKTRGSPPT
jgi:hypothetical protein